MTAARFSGPSLLFTQRPILRLTQTRLLICGMVRLLNVFFVMWRLRCAHRFSPFRFIYCSESALLSQMKQKYRGNLILDGVFRIARPVVEATQIEIEILIPFGFEQITGLLGMTANLTIHDNRAFFSEGVTTTFL